MTTCDWPPGLQCRFGRPVSFLLGPFHHPGVDVPQPAAVRLIRSRITFSSWIICPLVTAHAERNSACVSRTDQGCLAQYGCTKKRGLGASLYSLQVSAFVIQSSGTVQTYGKKGDHPAVYQPPANKRWTRPQGSNNLSQSVLAVR